MRINRFIRVISLPPRSSEESVPGGAVRCKGPPPCSATQTACSCSSEHTYNISAMHRRTFLRNLLGVGLVLPAAARKALAALPKMKITRIRLWESPLNCPMFNQSFHVVTVETDAGITGIGEGGSKDTIDECAAHLIGMD